MGIDPRLWGPSGWRFIHFVCLGAPEVLQPEQQKHYADFLHALAYVLPCGQCQMHYRENLRKHPLTSEVLATRASLFEWSVAMHNEVNKMHGKPLLTAAEALEKLMARHNDRNASGPSWVYITIVILLLVAIFMALVSVFRG